MLRRQCPIELSCLNYKGQTTTANAPLIPGSFLFIINRTNKSAK